MYQTLSLIEVGVEVYVYASLRPPSLHKIGLNSAGCEFSGVQTLRTLAMVESKRSRRGRYRQKNAHSIAFSGNALSPSQWS